MPATASPSMWRRWRRRRPSRRRTSAASFGARSASRRIATCSFGGWNGRRRSFEPPTAASPTSASPSGCAASGRSRPPSAGCSAARQRPTDRPIRRRRRTSASRRACSSPGPGPRAARLEKTAARATAKVASVCCHHRSGGMTMLKQLTFVNVWVHDQDEALAFYTEKLGMEVRADVTMPELGDFRWLTVGPPGQEDFAIVLMAIPGAPVMDEQTGNEVRNLMSKGFAGTVFLTTDDVRRDYEELKGRGVEFTEPPEERPYGIDSGFRDPSGNALRLTQVRDLAELQG